MMKYKTFDLCVDFQELLIKYLCSFYVVDSMIDAKLYAYFVELGNEIIKENKTLINDIRTNCNLKFDTENEIAALAVTLCESISTLENDITKKL